MVQTRAGVGRRAAVALACSALLGGILVVTGLQPAGANVTSVSGSAFGYYVNVGLFGGPSQLQGAGQVICTGSNVPAGCVTSSAAPASSSPSVTLPAGGSATEVAADDADGAKAQYGPAVIFGGLWPANVASAPASGPLSAGTQGLPGPGGSVTSRADLTLLDAPVSAGCATGYTPPCTVQGGLGPGPLTGDEAHSTCTATESGVSGSATFVNGVVELKYDATSQLPIVTEPIPDNPPPNYTRSGTIDHVGDHFTIVFNEQIVGPNSITVNAAHMYLLGEVARGDMVVASSTCSLTSSTANGAPVANDDTFTTAEDTPLTVGAAGVLVNDTDPDGNPLTAANAPAVFVPGPNYPAQTTDNTFTFPSDPPHGTASLNADGSFSYTPDANYSGPDTFTYVARDAKGANDSGTVTVTVTPVPDPPVAGDDTYRATEDTTLAVAALGVLANDTDGDGDTLSAGSASAAAHGSVTLNANGSFSYTPNANYVGPDSFTYVASDGTGGTDTGQVSISVVVDEAMLLKDVTPGIFGSSPSRSAVVGGSLYFLTSPPFTDDPTMGLWKTDGTAAGTVLVKAFSSTGSPPITVIGSTMFFQATDAANGAELWKSDGTTAGTVLVKDISAGTGSSSPANFRAIGSTLYFSASNGTTSGLNGTEVWKSDGTTAGTVLVKDINAGTGSSSPTSLTAVGSTLFFSASNGTTTGLNGTELWKSDGTTAGTVLVKDINAGTGNSTPAQFQVIGSTLYFRASNGTTTGLNGIELWRSDGTTAGTVMVKDISPGTSSGNPSSMIVFNGKLLFAATDGAVTYGNELWTSDGTDAGTTVVKDINLGPSNATPTSITAAGSVAYLSAISGSIGSELWQTDGTEAGTVLVKDISPGAGSSTSSNFAVANGTVYFTANDGTTGVELWKTDGTTAGTVLAKDIYAGSSSSSPAALMPALGTMFFSATTANEGAELWRLTPPKQVPVAGDDAFTTTEDTPLTVGTPGVLANDTDGNGDPLTAGSASDPANGTVALNANGSFTYTPDANFHGTDTFTYVVDDGDGGTDTGLVTITVTSVNDAPVAGDDTYGASAGTPLTVGAPGVLTNDTDVDLDNLSAGSASDPLHGTVALNANGSFTYTPDAGFSGADSFTYVVSDGHGGTDTATVSIAISANQAPVAGDDAYSATEDTPLTIEAPGVLANDIDPENDPLTAGSASDPANGTVVLNANGSFTYTPDADFSGVDTFTYVLSQGSAGTDTGLVTITVAPVNDAPVAGDDTYGTTSGTPLTVGSPGVLTNDTDVDDVAPSAGSPSDPANGSVVLNTDGSFTYTPDSGFAGTDTFTYTVSDGHGGTDTATVTITVTATGPGISVGSVSVVEGNSGTRNALFTVSLSEPSATTVAVSYATASGSAAAPGDYTSASGTLSFSPGMTTQAVKVAVLGDSSDEADETFTVALSGATGGVIADGTGTGTIIDDDPKTVAGLRVAIGDVSVHEGDSGTRKALFTVSLSAPATSTVKVNFATANGTAAKAVDYTKTSGTLTFPAGVTFLKVPVVVLPDDLAEGSETFAVTLSGASGATITRAAGLGAIIDDDD